MANLSNNAKTQQQISSNKLQTSINSFKRNQDLITALGGKDQSAPKPGLLTKTMNYLSIPGNLVRLGVGEVVGQAPQIEAIGSFPKELKAVATGKVKVGMGDLGVLRVNPNNGHITKALKLGGAFVGDVITDPLSYLGAPSSISKLEKATKMYHAAQDLLPEVVNNSIKGKNVIDELLLNSPKEDLANLQEHLNVVAKNNTPIDVQYRTSRDRVAAESLANHLASGYYKGGHQEVLTRLEGLTGSKEAAKKIWDKLPEDVKGGVVITNPLGTPLKTAEGKFIRVTPGTGEMLGDFGKKINEARFNVAAGPLKSLSFISKKHGTILAAAKEGLVANKEDVAGSRLADYINFRKLDKEVINNKAAWNAKTTATSAYVRHELTSLPEQGKEAFDYAFHSPQLVEPSTDPIINKGYELAKLLHQRDVELVNEANQAGLNINLLSDPMNHTSLVLTPESRIELNKTAKGKTFLKSFDTSMGRDYMARYADTPENKTILGGYTAANNPNVVFPNAAFINKAEEAKGSAIRFETDPIKIFQGKANTLTNRMASKNLTNGLLNLGLAFADNPETIRLTNDRKVAKFIGGLVEKSPAITRAKDYLDSQIASKLNDITDVTKLNDAQAKVAAERADTVNTFNHLDALYSKQKDIVKSVNAEVSATSAVLKDSKVQGFLKVFANEYTPAQLQAKALQKFIYDLRRKLGTADYRLMTHKEIIKLCREDLKTEKDKNTRWAIRKTISDLSEKNKSIKQVIEEYTPDLSTAQEDYVQALTVRNDILATHSTDLIANFQNYVNALSRQQDELGALQVIKEERFAAIVKKNALEKDFELEKVQEVDSIIHNYVNDKNEYMMAKSNVENLTKLLKRNGADPGMIDEFVVNESEHINNLKDNLDNSKVIYDNLLSVGNTKYNGDLNNYIENIKNVVDSLDADQYSAFQFLRSENSINEFLSILANNPSIDYNSEQNLIGNMAVAYMDIRDKFNNNIFEFSDKETEKIFRSKNLVKLEKKLFRKKEDQPSLLAKETVKEYSDITNQVGFERVDINNAEHLYATIGVRQALEEMFNVNKEPHLWEKYIKDIYNPLIQMWKFAVTLGRGPGYLLTNFSGGVYANYIANVATKSLSLAMRTLTDINVVTKQVKKEFPYRSELENGMEAQRRVADKYKDILIHGQPLDQLVKEYLDRAGFFAGESQYLAQTLAESGIATPEELLHGGVNAHVNFRTEAKSKTEQKFRGFVHFMFTNKVEKALMDAQNSIEMSLRFSVFIDEFAKTGNMDIAMDKVATVHFDYADLSPAENWLRMFVPFYTWSRNNVPAQLRAMVLQPGKIQRFLYANQEFQNTYGANGSDAWLNQYLPEYVTTSNGFATHFKFGDNNLGLFLKLPFEDVNKLFAVSNGKPTLRGNSIAGMMGPFTAPIEMASGVNLQTGQKFSPAGDIVPGWYNIFRAIPNSGVYTDAQGQTRAPGWLSTGIETALPMVNTAERTAAGINAIPKLFGAKYNTPNILFSQRQQAGGLANLLNTSGGPAVAGVSALTLTPQQVGAEVARRTQAQAVQIQKLADKFNIDPIWLQAQLKTGKTPQEIGIMIKAGQGKAGNSVTPQSRL